MQRVLIIGSPGAGKTTFAKALSQHLQLPLVHLDKLFWRGEWEQTPKEEFDAALQRELEQPQWIIDGNYFRTLDQRLAVCDTVIWLDLPTVVCLWRVIKRFLKHWGKSREDMGGNCVERLNKERLAFFYYVLTFRRRYDKQMNDLLKTRSHMQVIHLQTKKQVKKVLSFF